jgi:TolB-like protein/tetratricopeptide (TPR) repeat protein
MRNPAEFWAELRRRRVVRAALYYVAAAWVLAQATDLLLDAFDAARYMRFVVAGLVAGLPVATVLAWMFDVTPSGIERTHDLAVTPPAPAPEDSIAVLPFANLSQEPENEYFSDGLAEEIRNQLARVEGLRVAARSSSFAFKGRHEDVREVGRRLNVAAVLEGGVRKQSGKVRIDVQLVSAADGFQVWSQTFERRLDDIFSLQTEVACAVIAAIRPRAATSERPRPGPATQDFGAYNLYLLGRHHFHKRTESALRRAIECFREAITRDPGYALAYSGLADAHVLASTGYYGELPADEAIANALPAALQALGLAPDLAEAHASLGLIRHGQGDLDAAEQSLQRALQLNPGYTMAHVWLGLVLTSRGRYRDAAAHTRDAYRLDPLSPIINANAGFDALRFGDIAAAEAHFSAAIEIDPDFPVPYSGMARLQAGRGSPAAALLWIDRAIDRAPLRLFYLARKALYLAQQGQVTAAWQLAESACCDSRGNRFETDLVTGLRVVSGDQPGLERIVAGKCATDWSTGAAAQACIALGRLEDALRAYEEAPPEPRSAVDELVNDEWVWRLPHVVNHAHLRIALSADGGAQPLQVLQARAAELRAEGVVNANVTGWLASAHAVLGEHERALELLEEAIAQGWRHAWWARHDWNWSSLAGDSRWQALLARSEAAADPPGDGPG